MKKFVMLLLFVGLLSGCAAQETFETVSDPEVEVLAARPAELSVRLPDGAVAPVLEGELEQVYTAEDYEIILQTLPAGDLDRTVRTLSGYDREKLTVMETQKGSVTRYDFVWTSAGEQGDRLGRAAVLDDGQYHYCLSVLRDTETKQNTQIVWSDVFESFELV
ncbi:MAG: hypothetical protein Q4F17_12455 [Eubacteriales bacterium]|nr:hypothetical protein [Eubacteriales bacterium]